ncbi:uncharacterized protein LOC134969172 isoform X2 [Pseudophryne corroboree]|uniref:uncharacterized protein LOC134969172 isoform X2 n=1 Tax=Pseudophryne corroboree TaxID=495146 RepID=UPI0030817510
MTSRVIRDRWALSPLSLYYSSKSVTAVTCTALHHSGVSAFTRAAHPAPQPLLPKAVQPSRRSVPSLHSLPTGFSSPVTATRPYCNSRITPRAGALLPQSALLRPYCAAQHCFISRPLTISACTMAASGKIDLNSPSISWKEAKNYLKGLNNKQRREHYAVKDFIKLKDIPTWKDTAKKTHAKQPEEVKFPKNKDLNEKISIFRGDITKLEVDAIVNAGTYTPL